MSKEKSKKKSGERRRSALLPISSSPCMEINSNQELIIEGSRGVLEYSSESIRINTVSVIVSVSGRELDLKCISESALIIEGYITRIEFSE